jgi:hypothetical protein
MRNDHDMPRRNKVTAVNPMLGGRVAECTFVNVR